MGRFVVGQVVVIPFPFSDLKDSKLRPALVLAVAEDGDLILCQITSRSYSSLTALKLTSKDFATGNLPIDSYVRPDKIFTADDTIVTRIVGKLKPTTTRSILEQVRKLFV